MRWMKWETQGHPATWQQNWDTRSGLLTITTNHFSSPYVLMLTNIYQIATSRRSHTFFSWILDYSDTPHTCFRATFSIIVAKAKRCGISWKYYSLRSFWNDKTIMDIKGNPKCLICLPRLLNRLISLFSMWRLAVIRWYQTFLSLSSSWFTGGIRASKLQPGNWCAVPRGIMKASEEKQEL